MFTARVVGIQQVQGGVVIAINLVNLAGHRFIENLQPDLLARIFHHIEAVVDKMIHGAALFIDMLLGVVLAP